VAHMDPLEGSAQFRTQSLVGCHRMSSGQDIEGSSPVVGWTEKLQAAASRGDPLDLADADAVPARAIRDAVTGSVAVQTPLRRLVLRNARVLGPFDMDAMSVACSLIFENCVFTGLVSLREAEVASLRLPGCVLREGLDASGIVVRGALELNDGCQAHRPVVLNRARIGTWLDCSGGRFRSDGGGAIYAEAMVVDGDVVLARGFCCDGEARLGATEIKGQLNCTGGHFRNPGGMAITADSLRVREDLVCAISGNSRTRRPWEYAARCVASGPKPEPARAGSTDEFLAEGQVVLVRAEIDGELRLEAGEIRNPGAVALSGDSVKVGGRALLGRGLKVNGQVRLQRAEIGSQLRMECLIIPAHEPIVNDDLALDLEAAYVSRALILRPPTQMSGMLILINGRFGHLRDFQAAWTDKKYRLFGVTFGSLGRTSVETDDGEEFPTTRFGPLNENDRVRDVRNRLNWLEGDYDGYQPWLYDQLAEHYRRAGEEASQAEVLMAKQRGRRKWLPRTAKWWNTTLDKLMGYGYETWKVLIPLGALLVAGFVFFWVEHSANHILKKDPTQNEPTFHSLIYTIDLLMPIIGLGQRENFTARNGAEIGAACFLLCGWVLSSLLLAGLSGLVRRFNR
jgi:hypothetical protein